MYELQTVYGLEDVYDMLEIAQIDGYNGYLAQKAAMEEQDG